jgi:hypothetical protein
MRMSKIASARCIFWTLSFLACCVGSSLSNAAEITFADGKPWKMIASDTRGGTIVFNADGSGMMGAGIMSIKLSWFQKDKVTCIKMGIMGEHCLQFKPMKGGFEGFEQGSNRKMKLFRN